MAAVFGFGAFAALGVLVTPDTWAQPWFFVGLGVVLSAVFVEPYFGNPRAAILNGVGGLGACAGADRGSVEALWIATGLFFGFVAFAGAVAVLTGDGALKVAARQFSARFGRAALVGTWVLLLIVLTEAAQGRGDFELLAVATVILIASVSFDWPGLWVRVTHPDVSATAVAAIGPRMILAVTAAPTLAEGDSVTIGDTPGRVLARLPHSDGLRHQIALADDWTAVCRAFPQDIQIKKAATEDDIAGVVGRDTTQNTLELEPFRPLAIGDPLVVSTPGQELLYQVARLRLTDAVWAGSRSIVPHATAHLVGRPEPGVIRTTTYLPDAHHLVHRADNLAGSLDQNYYELGHIKGTSIPIGIRTDDDRRGHIAILGMSGMGKTAVAHRICGVLGLDHVVVALDTTGEYETRLKFSPWEDNDFSTEGHFVHQPGGDPPANAADFIKRFMEAGSHEYRNGQTPTRRVILLEEAHTFLPEWNVAIKHQQEKVAYSTRMIMQARKFGLTFVIVSQRTAVVSKSALSQCENYIILKTLDHTGLEYLESLVGPQMRDAIPSLERYEAMCVGPAFNAESPVIVTLNAP